MKKYRERILFTIVIIAILSFECLFAFAAGYPAHTSNFFVNDFANVINYNTEQSIQSTAVQLQNKTGAQVVVVTINSLEGQSLEDYAIGLFREWGIGEQGKDNGVLILVAVEDRKSRIEVGYGLEGALPDGKTGRIQDEYMIPDFQQENYSAGILNGFLAIVKEVYNEYGLESEGIPSLPEPHRIPQEANDDVKTFFLLISAGLILLIDWIFLGGRITRFLMLLALSGGRGGRGGGWGGGRGGGGFSGGGFSGRGGSSGGGGSSRGW